MRPGGDAPLDLRTLGVEEGGSVEVTVPVSSIELRLGAQDYRVEGAESARLEVSRSLAGLHLRLRVAGRLAGPCWRCLGDALVPVDIDVREYVATGREAGARFDDDLDSVYVEDEHVEVALWVRDAFAEAVPPMILCREDCAGLCPVCGVDRNSGSCGCGSQQADPRWGPLREIAERMRIDEG